MPRTIPWLLLLLGLATSLASLAAPPQTLAYQGRLADAGGNPINSALAITFRLYEQAAGGSALWTETQPGVDVDGGNFAVELGAITPLPRSIWGRQIYLGIQIAGDSEMAPRPPLTAAPFALRAAGTMRRTLVVSAEGTPLQNGAALLAAVSGISDASAASPVAVELDAGVYDLGSVSLVMPSFTTIRGRGSETVLTSSNASSGVTLLGSATLHLGSDTAARDLVAINTGIPASDASYSTWGIRVGVLDSTDAAENVSIERVVGEASAPTGALGQRAGISICAYNSRATAITGRAIGGLFASGLRGDCPFTQNLVIDGAVIESFAASDGARGALLVAGRGNVYRGLEIKVEILPSAQSAYGVRIFELGAFPSTGPEGELVDSTIRMLGDASVISNAGTISGFQTEIGAQFARLQRVDIVMAGVRGGRVQGIWLRDNASNAPALASLRIEDSSIRISGYQDPAIFQSPLMGIRFDGFTPAVSGSRVEVTCLPGSANACIGVGQSSSAQIPPTGSAPLQLFRSWVKVRQLSQDASASVVGLQLLWQAAVGQSTLFASRTGGVPATGISLINPAANMSVSGSSIVVHDDSGANSLCLFAGPSGASGSWYGNVSQGTRCDGGQVAMACAGNTASGVGFLASTCP